MLFYSCKKKAKHNMVFGGVKHYRVVYHQSVLGKIWKFSCSQLFSSMFPFQHTISPCSLVCFPNESPNIRSVVKSPCYYTVLFPRFSEQFPSWKSRPSGYDIHSLPWKDPPLRTVNHLFRLGPSIPWRTVNVITRPGT